jgi:hypothetical protein
MSLVSRRISVYRIRAENTEVHQRNGDRDGVDCEVGNVATVKTFRNSMSAWYADILDSPSAPMGAVV